MTLDLERARRIRAAIADGVLPCDGWPTVADEAAHGDAGDPVPKCSMIECCEPATAHVTAASLTSLAGFTAYACPGHLDHFSLAAGDWVRPPTPDGDVAPPVLVAEADRSDRERIYDAFGLTEDERDLCEHLAEVEAPAREAAERQRAAFVEHLRDVAAEVSARLAERLRGG